MPSVRLFAFQSRRLGAVAVGRGFWFGHDQPVHLNNSTCGNGCLCISVPHCATSVTVSMMVLLPAVRIICSAEGRRTMVCIGLHYRLERRSVDCSLPILALLSEYTEGEKRAKVEAVLRRIIKLFAWHEYDVGDTDLIRYKLEFEDPSARSVCEPLRQHTTAYLAVIDAEVDRLLRFGLIARRNSPWASNVVLVNSVHR